MFNEKIKEKIVIWNNNTDCGGNSEESYDSYGRLWTPDDLFNQTGNKETMKDSFSSAAQPSQLQTLRSFPQGVKNCYVLQPLEEGTKYLLRATFVYGNYDDLNSPPTFDLLLDANLWDTISLLNVEILIKEIISMANSSSINVCLARSSNQNPIISSLELRPITQIMYGSVTENYALLLLERTNFGAPQKDIRYPDDPFDRIWSPSSEHFPAIRTEKNVSVGVATDNPPSTVMQTAERSYRNSTSRMDLPNRVNKKIGYLYISMYFSELQELNTSSIREFNVYINNDPPYGPLQPKYVESTNISLLKQFETNQIHFALEATNRSKLSSLVNALEIYRRSDRFRGGTFAQDVEALADIKRVFRLENDSAGDPCLPFPYSWDWLECTDDPLPRIGRMNLSDRGLTGKLPESITHLTALLSLNFEYNNLSGVVPPGLTQIKNLSEFRLSGNEFLCKVGENQCSESRSKESSRKGLIVGSAIAPAVALAFVCAAVAVNRKCAGKKAPETFPLMKNRATLNDLDGPRSRAFTYKERVWIKPPSPASVVSERAFRVTFPTSIGIRAGLPHDLPCVKISKGGFGPVFLGHLQNGLEVAVKVLSECSRQGAKEFSTEVALLSRVHHKNLVSLVGYCSEGENQILIYEYMSKGNLHDLLHESNAVGHLLNWETKLDIALNSAQGLEYLHSGCKPRIIHRDVKSANFLLSDQMEAKVADFGLSRVWPSTEATHVSTDVKGTFGYLDPEYAVNNNLTEKSDVCSFGVVILEIISGRWPIHRNSSGEQTPIVSWARALIYQGNIEAILDPKAGNIYNMSAMWKVAELAMACTENQSNDRPTMNEVVMELKETIRLLNATNPADNEVNNYVPFGTKASSANEMSSIPFPR
eukprot:Gb_40646 [translate_table: standard]